MGAVALMDFSSGQTVYRDRRARVADPYNPAVTTDGDWDPTLTITLPGAFVASSSSLSTRNLSRKEILTLKSLYLTNPQADVLPGDRIRTADIPFDGGSPYFVEARPAADTNPWTGWQPAVQIPLTLVEG